MKQYKLIALAAIASLSFFACTQNKVQRTAVETLCSRNWSCVSVTDNGVPVTEPCLTSGMLVFTTRQRGSDYHLVKCSPAQPSENDFQWVISQDAQVLTMTVDTGATLNLRIITLSKSTLDFIYTAPNNHSIHGVYSAM